MATIELFAHPDVSDIISQGVGNGVARYFFDRGYEPDTVRLEPRPFSDTLMGSIPSGVVVNRTPSMTGPDDILGTTDMTDLSRLHDSGWTRPDNGILSKVLVTRGSFVHYVGERDGAGISRSRSNYYNVFGRTEDTRYVLVGDKVFSDHKELSRDPSRLEAAGMLVGYSTALKDVLAPCKMDGCAMSPFIADSLGKMTEDFMDTDEIPLCDEHPSDPLKELPVRTVA